MRGLRSKGGKLEARNEGKGGQDMGGKNGGSKGASRGRKVGRRERGRGQSIECAEGAAGWS